MKATGFANKFEGFINVENLNVCSTVTAEEVFAKTGIIIRPSFKDGKWYAFKGGQCPDYNSQESNFRYFVIKDGYTPMNMTIMPWTMYCPDDGQMYTQELPYINMFLEPSDEPEKKRYFTAIGRYPKSQKRGTIFSLYGNWYMISPSQTYSVHKLTEEQCIQVGLNPECSIFM